MYSPVRPNPAVVTVSATGGPDVHLFAFYTVTVSVSTSFVEIIFFVWFLSISCHNNKADLQRDKARPFSCIVLVPEREAYVFALGYAGWFGNASTRRRAHHYNSLDDDEGRSRCVAIRISL